MKRSGQIDIARGIGILLVVFGHNWIILNEKKELFHVIYSFHMPLFFFLSGLLIKSTLGFKETFYTKTESLLKPYFTTLILLGLYKFLKSNINLIDYLCGVLYGSGHTILWIPLWFLTHLWILLIISWFVIKFIWDKQNSLIFKVLFLCALLFLGQASIYYFWNMKIEQSNVLRYFFVNTDLVTGLPFSIDIIPFSMFFLLIGYACKKYLSLLKFNSIWFFAAVFGFVFLHIIYDDTIDFFFRIYNSLIVSTIQALLGTYIVFVLADILEKYHKASKILIYIGQNSLIILIFHHVIQQIMFDKFNVFLPISKYGNGLLAFILCIVITLFISELIRRIRFLTVLFLPMNRKLI